MDEIAPIDPQEFEAGRQVEFHHMHGCEACAKLQRLLMRYQELQQIAKTAKEELDRREYTQKRSWEHEKELQASVEARDDLIDLLLEKLADKILEVRES